MKSPIQNIHTWRAWHLLEQIDRVAAEEREKLDLSFTGDKMNSVPLLEIIIKTCFVHVNLINGYLICV